MDDIKQFIVKHGTTGARLTPEPIGLEEATAIAAALSLAPGEYIVARARY